MIGSFYISLTTLSKFRLYQEQKVKSLQYPCRYSFFARGDLIIRVPTVCNILRFQRGASRVCLQSTWPSWLRHEPVSLQPQLLRKYHLGILQVQWIVQNAESYRLHDRQFRPFHGAALDAMVADSYAESMHIQLKHLYEVIATGIVDICRSRGISKIFSLCKGTLSLRWCPLSTSCATRDDSGRSQI